MVVLVDEAQELPAQSRALAVARSPADLPSMMTSPSSGRSSRPAICSRVDLPLPDWPTRATISPGLQVER